MFTDDTCLWKTVINSKTTYIKLKWIENDKNLFHLQVLCDDDDGGSSWSGTFTTELAQKFIEEEDPSQTQTKNEYYNNVKNCLSGEDGDKYVLGLSVIDADTATFTWKKRFEGFHQIYGSLNINRDDNLSKDTMIEFLINKNNELKNHIFVTEERNKEISEELAKSKSELEKFVNIKNDLESTLYGKFIQLLNTKKQRIKFLEEQLQIYMD